MAQEAEAIGALVGDPKKMELAVLKAAVAQLVQSDFIDVSGVLY